MIDRAALKQIYDRLGDEQSKELFEDRLMYAITGEDKWVFRMVKTAPGGKAYLQKLRDCSGQEDMVVFGAGTWGKILYHVIKIFPWKCFVDSHPKTERFCGLPVIEFADFLKLYHGESVLISPRLYHCEMYAQLIDAGIPPHKIINAGELIDWLSKVQYFDLEPLRPAEGKEVFVDIGAFDGMTSVQFGRWGKADAMAYLFEPDADNIEKCRRNLGNSKMPYRIIPKGAWSSETDLHFMAAANSTSKVHAQGDVVIQTGTVDSELAGEAVTFIKMDIEGAEKEALIGAEQTIRSHTPKLAISVYHKPEDIWELPELVLQYNPDYKLFLRHYSLTESETVLYAIP